MQGRFAKIGLAFNPKNEQMNNIKCLHIVDNSKSRNTIPHYYCRKTGKVAVTILHQTLYCEECPYSKNENADKA